MLRVFLCDDEPDVRLLLRLRLEEDGGFRIVGEAGDAETLLREAPAIAPDVVVLDLRLPGREGPEVIRAVRSAVPGAAVVVHTGMDPEYVQADALAAGAVRVVRKSGAADELRQVLRRL